MDNNPYKTSVPMKKSTTVLPVAVIVIVIIAFLCFIGFTYSRANPLFFPQLFNQQNSEESQQNTQNLIGVWSCPESNGFLTDYYEFRGDATYSYYQINHGGGFQMISQQETGTFEIYNDLLVLVPNTGNREIDTIIFSDINTVTFENSLERLTGNRISNEQLAGILANSGTF